jgi:hypothetical protein
LNLAGVECLSPELLTFNGINAATGAYLLPPLTLQELSPLAQGEVLDPAHLSELKWRYQQASQTPEASVGFPQCRYRAVSTA